MRWRRRPAPSSSPSPSAIYIDGALLLYWFLGVILAVCFLTVTGNPRRPRRGSLFGWTAAALALLISLYFMSRQPVYERRLPMIDPLSVADQVAAIVMILLVLEATRRVIGFTLVAVVLVFLAYGVFGQWIEGPFSHRALSLREMLDQLVFTSNGLFGSALHVAAFLVFVFVTFGALLDRCGGGDFFFDLANSLVGRQVGGPAKVAVVSSGLYGSISGSPTADVVTTGAFTIPLMIRTGLSPVYAGAIEATASTGGALLPPVMGTAAFLMADFTGIPYGTIAVAAVFPALLYYFAIFLAVHDRAKLDGLKPSADADTPSFVTVVRANWYFFVPIVLLIWFVLRYDRPVFSAAVALASLVPIALWRLRSLGKLVATISTPSTTPAAHDQHRRRLRGGRAGGRHLGMTDLTGKIASAMFTLAKGSQLLTLMIATVVVIVLGMGMPTPAVYALSAVLAGPALQALGIPVLPAHLFIVYFASMSAITPPVAPAPRRLPPGSGRPPRPVRPRWSSARSERACRSPVGPSGPHRPPPPRRDGGGRRPARGADRRSARRRPGPRPTIRASGWPGPPRCRPRRCRQEPRCRPPGAPRPRSGRRSALQLSRSSGGQHLADGASGLSPPPSGRRWRPPVAPAASRRPTPADPEPGARRHLQADEAGAHDHHPLRLGQVVPEAYRIVDGPQVVHSPPFRQVVEPAGLGARGQHQLVEREVLAALELDPPAVEVETRCCRPEQPLCVQGGGRWQGDVLRLSLTRQDLLRQRGPVVRTVNFGSNDRQCAVVAGPPQRLGGAQPGEGGADYHDSLWHDPLWHGSLWHGRRPYLSPLMSP